MDQSPIDAVAERIDRLEGAIDRLERENREIARPTTRQSLGLLVLAAALGSACTFLAERAFVASSSKVVSAEKFLLRDSTGRKRAELAMAVAGAPILIFYDEEGHGRLHVTALPDGSAGMSVFDASGKRRMMTGLEKDQKTVILAFFGPDGNPRMTLSTNPDSPTSLVLYDPAGRSRTLLGVEPGGAGGLEFQNEAGETVFRTPQP